MKIPALRQMRFVLVLFLLFLPHLARAATTIVTVGMGGGRTFSPATVTIQPGDTVQWNWAGSNHSSTSGTAPNPDGLWDSGVLNSPATFSRPFPVVGSFPYYCTVHGAMMSGTVNVVAPTATPSPTPEFTVTPTPIPTPTPTPALISISGTLPYCFGNPTPGPVAGVTLTLTGSASGSTLSDSSGNYQFSALPSGGSYTVTPAKSPIPVGTSPGLSTVDVIGVQRHFLGITLLTGCKLAAADVNHNGNADTTDVIIIQRYVLQYLSGTGDAGKYQFTPVSRTYSGVTSNQTNQNYDTLVFGDVAGNSVHRPEGLPPDAAGGDGSRIGEVPSTVATVALPDVVVDQLKTRFAAAVTTSAIDGKNNLVGFQGDFTFDSRVVRFESEPVRKAGLTGGNWNVSGNVLPGSGPIRTLRVSAYSQDFRPLSGEGTLFELKMARVSKGAQSTQLLWAATPDQFFFIDSDLNTQRPGSASSGRVR